MQLKEIIKLMNLLAPPQLAMAGDSNGLQVGAPSEEIKKILVCLTLTEKIARQAANKKVNLIIAHHPLMTTPLKEIDTSASFGKLLKILFKNNISFFNAHTNLDVVPGGVSDILARAAGLNPPKCSVLLPVYREKLYKLAVFVPEEYTAKVFKALTAAGAGWLGNYDSCTFTTPGIGTFRPQKGTRPFIGQAGRISRVNEDKIETIVPEFILDNVLAALKLVHPYEEVADDIYPLSNEGRIYGLGRIGRLAKPMSLAVFINNIKKKFKEIKVHSPEKGKNKIRLVAASPGSGSSLINEAMARRADIFLTGEVKYHQLLEAASGGLTVIEVGHHDSEQMAVPVVVQYLKEKTNIPIITL